MNNIKIFVATKAFLIHNGKVLLLRESNQYQDGTNAGKFDVVGGRVKPGQRFDESLLREIKEETGLEAKIGRPFYVDEWRPEKNGEIWHIVGTFFECEVDSDQVQLSEDHDDYKWIEPETFMEQGVIENLYPAFEAYLDYLS